MKPPATGALEARLQNLLNEAVGKPGRLQIYASVQTSDGLHAAVRGGQPAAPASISKLPLLVLLEDAWAAGRLKRKESDAELARRMIVESDNLAAEKLLKLVGRREGNERLAELGYTSTRLSAGYQPASRARSGRITADEAARMMLMIATGKMVSAAASGEMASWLEAQTRRNRIPAGLPPGIRCGNKTGSLNNLTHDAAYVVPQDGHPYSLALLMEGPGTEAEHSRKIREISKKIYGLLSRR